MILVLRRLFPKEKHISDKENRPLAQLNDHPGEKGASLGQTDRLATIFTERNAPNESQSPAFAFKSSLSNYGLLRRAYCSLFPRHPAAILQLLIFFTSVKEKRKAALSSGLRHSSALRSFWRQNPALRRERDSRRASHLDSEVVSANELLRGRGATLQNENLGVFPPSCRFLFHHR